MKTENNTPDKKENSNTQKVVPPKNTLPESIEKFLRESDLDDYTRNKLRKESQAIELNNKKTLKELQKNTMIAGGIGAFILIASLVLYIVPEISHLQDVKQEIVEKKESIEKINLQKLSDEATHDKLSKERESLSDQSDALLLALPRTTPIKEYEEAKSRIAVFFEDFALNHHKTNSSIEILNIDMGKETTQGEMGILPIKMSISASEENFKLFVNTLYKRSGSLDPKDFYISPLTKKKEPIPLMRIDSLSISLPQAEDTGKTLLGNTSKKSKDILNFSVEISAYFKSTPAGKVAIKK